MDVILLSVKWWSSILYLDNTVVSSKTKNGHMARLRQALTLLWNAGVTFKLKTCSIMAKKINYLGHNIRPEGMELPEATTTVVCELNNTTTQTKLRSFSPLCRVSRCFIRNFPRMTILLNMKLRKEQLISFRSYTMAEKDAVE